MTSIVFCNVGMRDVRVDGALPEGAARTAGEALLQQADFDPSRLSFPVIEPALEYVLNQVDHIDELVFIGVDQENEAARLDDTLYFARLVADVLGTRFADGVTSTSVDYVGSDPPVDPALYDEAFSGFERLVRDQMKRDYDVCFVLPFADLPACNTALILQCIAIFADCCEVVYNTEKGHPWPLQIGHQITHVMRNAAAIELLEDFDFAAALRLLSWSNEVDEVSIALVKYGSARLDFDFDRARHNLERAIQKGTGDLRRALQAPRDELAKLLEEDPLTRIAEMYYNARIAWDGGRYVSYLGRLIRFQEAVLRELVTRYFPEPGGNMGDAFSGLAIHPELRHLLLGALEHRTEHTPPRTDVYADRETLRCLRDAMIHYFNLSELRDLCFDLAIDFENLGGEGKNDKIRELIDYARRTDHLVELVEAVRARRPDADWHDQVEVILRNPGNLRAALAALRRIDRLVPLRNASIIGHGFSGVSQEIIMDLYNGELDGDVEYNPVQDMAIICGVLDIQLLNPFRDIRDVIIKRLR